MNSHARVFRGVDYALQEENCAITFVADVDGCLEVLKNHEEPAKLSAIDSPLGTTAGFSALLAGREPLPSKDGFQTRATERWAREHVKNFGIVGYWSRLNTGDFQDHESIDKKPGLFNGGSHVQPTTAMRIVPACLDFVLENSLQSAEPAKRHAALVAARRGNGPFVEAHPRLFLYSALERIYESDPATVTPDLLFAAAKYRTGESHRHVLYTALRDSPAWMGAEPREVLPTEPPDWLVGNDHAFDAWLCALTAWAHDQSETLDWRAADITSELVDVEGHMLILDTKAPAL